MAWDLRAAQQALSEKYGIPTFDVKGFLSTVPQTRPASGINVNQGIYGKLTGSTVEQFQAFVKTLSPQKATVPTSPVVLSGGTIIDIPNTSKLVKGETPLTSREIPKSIITSIQQYTPYIILGGIALLAITLIKK